MNKDNSSEVTEQKAFAQLLKPREGAEARYWELFIKNRIQQIARREQLVGVIYWQPAWRMPIDLFSYFREALRCFAIAQFLGAITLSSCAVELILNRDQRVRSNTELRRIGGWTTLNNHNLIIASSLGLPVSSLCSANESLQKEPPLVFVERRNKVAHGEVMPMLKTLSDYDPRAEEEALDQVIKSQNFVIEWFNTAPDVQKGLIVNHRWP